MIIINVIKFVGKLYNLFKFKEFSSIELVKFVVEIISKLIKKLLIIKLSIKTKKNNVIKIIEILINVSFIDNENISFEAKEVT